MTTVLFACVHNAGRSQMAAAFFNHLVDPTRARAISAGTNPCDRINPEAIRVMKEEGIEIGDMRPRRLTLELAREAQLLVTMGCADESPLVPGLERDDWPLEDPKGRKLEEVRRIRNQIRRRVVTMLWSRGWA